MNFAPLTAAPAFVLVHAAAATIALASGTIVMALTKGTVSHVWLGRSFALAMFITATTSFAITGTGHFSPIHLLSVITLITLPLAIISRRRGNIAAHARGMVVLYVSLLIAGGFTLRPHRLLGHVFLSSL